MLFRSRVAEINDIDCEFHEFTSIEYEAGYGSIFGDRNKVEIDLCQRCMKELLGPWLRVTDHQEAHFGLDLRNHGGESPVQSDRLFQGSRSHENATIQEFSDNPKEAAAYLKAVLERGDKDEIKMALRRIAAAFGHNK